ncbi:MAG: hypothetical protein EZS28_015805, partial [Streblomastix strix]
MMKSEEEDTATNQQNEAPEKKHNLGTKYGLVGQFFPISIFAKIGDPTFLNDELRHPLPYALNVELTKILERSVSFFTEKPVFNLKTFIDEVSAGNIEMTIEEIKILLVQLFIGVHFINTLLIPHDTVTREGVFFVADSTPRIQIISFNSLQQIGYRKSRNTHEQQETLDVMGVMEIGVELLRYIGINVQQQIPPLYAFGKTYNYDLIKTNDINLQLEVLYFTSTSNCVNVLIDELEDADKDSEIGDQVQEVVIQNQQEPQKQQSVVIEEKEKQEQLETKQQQIKTNDSEDKIKDNEKKIENYNKIDINNEKENIQIKEKEKIIIFEPQLMVKDPKQEKKETDKSKTKDTDKDKDKHKHKDKDKDKKKDKDRTKDKDKKKKSTHSRRETRSNKNQDSSIQDDFLSSNQSQTPAPSMDMNGDMDEDIQSWERRSQTTQSLYINPSPSETPTQMELMDFQSKMNKMMSVDARNRRIQNPQQSLRDAIKQKYLLQQEQKKEKDDELQKEKDQQLNKVMDKDKEQEKQKDLEKIKANEERLEKWKEKWKQEQELMQKQKEKEKEKLQQQEKVSKAKNMIDELMKTIDSQQETVTNKEGKVDDITQIEKVIDEAQKEYLEKEKEILHGRIEDADGGDETMSRSSSIQQLMGSMTVKSDIYSEFKTSMKNNTYSPPTAQNKIKNQDKFEVKPTTKIQIKFDKLEPKSPNSVYNSARNQVKQEPVIIQQEQNNDNNNEIQQQPIMNEQEIDIAVPSENDQSNLNQQPLIIEEEKISFKTRKTSFQSFKDFFSRKKEYQEFEDKRSEFQKQQEKLKQKELEKQKEKERDLEAENQNKLLKASNTLMNRPPSKTLELEKWEQNMKEQLKMGQLDTEKDKGDEKENKKEDNIENKKEIDEDKKDVKVNDDKQIEIIKVEDKQNQKLDDKMKEKDKKKEEIKTKDKKKDISNEKIKKKKDTLKLKDGEKDDNKNLKEKKFKEDELQLLQNISQIKRSQSSNFLPISQQPFNTSMSVQALNMINSSPYTSYSTTSSITSSQLTDIYRTPQKRQSSLFAVNQRMLWGENDESYVPGMITSRYLNHRSTSAPSQSLLQTPQQPQKLSNTTGVWKDKDELQQKEPDDLNKEPDQKQQKKDESLTHRDIINQEKRNAIEEQSKEMRTLFNYTPLSLRPRRLMNKEMLESLNENQELKEPQNVSNQQYANFATPVVPRYMSPYQSIQSNPIASIGTQQTIQIPSTIPNTAPKQYTLSPIAPSKSTTIIKPPQFTPTPQMQFFAPNSISRINQQQSFSSTYFQQTQNNTLNPP